VVRTLFNHRVVKHTNETNHQFNSPISFTLSIKEIRRITMADLTNICNGTEADCFSHAGARRRSLVDAKAAAFSD
jgi:hypothetical protein